MSPMRPKASRGGSRAVSRKGILFAVGSFLVPFCWGVFIESAFAQNAVSTGTRAGFRMFYPNSNDWWLDPSQGRFDIRVNGASPMATFNALGNLGIGTTAPSFPLDTKNTAGAFDGLRVWNSGSNRNAGVIFQNTQAITEIGVGLTVGGSVFEVYDQVGSAARLFIAGGGNVGVGTAGPGELLHINRASDGQGIKIQNGAYGGGYITIKGADLDLGGVVSSYYHTVRFNMATSNQNAGSGADRTMMALFREGWSNYDAVSFPSASVGIGTTSPQFKLDILGGSSTADPTFSARNSAAGGGSVAINTFSGALSIAAAGDALISNGVGNLLISPNAAQKDIKFIGGSWAQPVSMVIKDGGNVGIGTTNPQGKLDMSNSAIVNVAEPINGSDAATRGWVLAQVGGGATGFGNLVGFNAAGNTNWTVPSGVTKIQVDLCGGGGGGGGAYYGANGGSALSPCAGGGGAGGSISNGYNGGGGGGGGAYARGQLSVTAGSVLVITVGAGGAGAAGLYGNGTAGGMSKVVRQSDSVVLISGGGGSGGSGGNNGLSGGAGGSTTQGVNGQPGANGSGSGVANGGNGGGSQLTYYAGGVSGSGATYTGLSAYGGSGNPGLVLISY